MRSPTEMKNLVDPSSDFLGLTMNSPVGTLSLRPVGNARSTERFEADMVVVEFQVHRCIEVSENIIWQF